MFASWAAKREHMFGIQRVVKMVFFEPEIIPTGYF